MKNKKSVIITIVFALCLVLGFSYTAMALPPTSISQGELATLSSMTLDQLNVVAKPMPESAIKYRNSPTMGGVIKQFGLCSTLPYDGIYYIENINLAGDIYKEFYKLLYVSPASTNIVTYHIYVWYYVNEDISNKGETSGDEGNNELYNALVSNNQNGEISQDTNSDGRDASSSGDSNNNTSSGSNNDSVSGKIYTKKRLAGLNRIETSVRIAQELYSDTVQNVVIATGNDFPDALSGSVLAKKLNAPILLFGSNINDSTETIEYIKTHLNSNGTIYLLGGSGAVPDSLAKVLNDLGYLNIKRLYGQGRYETNQAINSELGVPVGTPIVIATGENFPDALSISSVSAAKGYPIVLSQNDTLSNSSVDTIMSIKPSKVYIVGGQGAISANVEDALESLTGLSSDNIIRLSGNDRYETSLNIAKYFNQDSDTITFATGENFPDALAGSVLSAKLNASILLIGNNETEQKKYIDNSKYINQIYFGGVGAITQAIEDALLK